MLVGKVLLVGLLPVLALTGCVPGVQILSGFGETHFMRMPRNPRAPVHQGIDIAGYVGQPVLAAADGTVEHAGQEHELCGVAVRITHEPVRFLTRYCHLAEASVKPSMVVKRGDVIGSIGETGLWKPLTHVHFELREYWTPIDPMPYVVGCLDPQQTYPTGRLALTWPVKC